MSVDRFCLLAVIAGIAIGILDYFAAFAAVAWWAVAGIVIAGFGSRLLRRTSVPRIAALAVLALWLVVLPFIRWNVVKSFYIDCNGITPGASVEEVKRMMSGYRLQRESPGNPGGSSALDAPHLTFHPSVDRSSDWCVVYTVSGLVESVEILPD